MELNEQKLHTAFVNVITRNRGADPLTLADKLVERLAYLMEDADSSFGVDPIRITRSEPETLAPELEPVKRKLERERGAALPPPQSSIIIMPETEEFKQAEKMISGEGSRNVKPTRLSRVTDASKPPQKYWDYASLIQQLARSTPEKFYFTPNGRPDAKILAVRNIISQQGLDQVRIEYGNPGISDDRMDEAGDDKSFVLGLKATKIISLFEPEVNIESIMDDLEAQLKGLYQDRTNMQSEVPLPPSPMEEMLSGKRFNQASAMGAEHTINVESGWRTMENPANQIRDNIHRDNLTTNTNKELREWTQSLSRS